MPGGGNSTKKEYGRLKLCLFIGIENSGRFQYFLFHFTISKCTFHFGKIAKECGAHVDHKQTFSYFCLIIDGQRVYAKCYRSELNIIYSVNQVCPFPPVWANRIDHMVYISTSVDELNHRQRKMWSSSISHSHSLIFSLGFRFILFNGMLDSIKTKRNET